jgi:DNA-binding protein YbaB
MNSNGKIESLVIDDLVKTKSPNAIEDLVREAINDAVEKVDAEVERVTNEEMRKVATDPTAMKVRVLSNLTLILELGRFNEQSKTRIKSVN